MKIRFDRAALRWIPAAIPVILLACSLVPVQAARQARYTMEVLVDGRPLTEHALRGTTYVEAQEGREYAIRLRNRSGERVAVALTVDGLNTIDARTTPMHEASKWIVEPWSTITIEGWQTDLSAARRFFFTTEERSYGEWLGQTSNLGVISAAFFRERRPRPAPITTPQEKRRDRSSPRARSGEGAEAPESSRDAAARSEGEGQRREAAPQADEYAATGIGRRLDHEVRRVRFRAERDPAAVLTVRYEFRDALVRLGVLPDPWARCEDPLRRRERARGFDDGGFSPDPWAFLCR